MVDHTPNKIKYYFVLFSVFDITTFIARSQLSNFLGQTMSIHILFKVLILSKIIRKL